MCSRLQTKNSINTSRQQGNDRSSVGECLGAPAFQNGSEKFRRTRFYMRNEWLNCRDRRPRLSDTDVTFRCKYRFCRRTVEDACPYDNVTLLRSFLHQIKFNSCADMRERQAAPLQQYIYLPYRPCIKLRSIHI